MAGLGQRALETQSHVGHSHKLTGAEGHQVQPAPCDPEGRSTSDWASLSQPCSLWYLPGPALTGPSETREYSTDTPHPTPSQEEREKEGKGAGLFLAKSGRGYLPLILRAKESHRPSRK